MEIASNGAWLNKTNEGHCFDHKLAQAIAEFCQQHHLNTLLDLGCGDGSYVEYFTALSEHIYPIGLDGNPHTMAIANCRLEYPRCFTADLSVPLRMGNKVSFELALALEVGEHVPKGVEGIFIDNVCKYTREWVILSWAIPNQTGDGHVNCKTNEEIIDHMVKRGFGYWKKASEELRDAAELPWFKDTVMVFKRY